MFDGVSLTVECGDRVLIRGETGAGKTTSFDVLGLLEPPTAGTVAGEGAGDRHQKTITAATPSQASFGVERPPVCVRLVRGPSTTVWTPSRWRTTRMRAAGSLRRRWNSREI